MFLYLNKAISILLAVTLAFCISACKARPPEPVTAEEPLSSSEAVPKKPTAAEAAKHNEAIDSAIRLIQFDDPDHGDEIAVISTTEGDIKVRLFKTQAPETVSAFIKLAEDGHYNGGEFADAVDGYKIDGAGKAGDSVFPEDEFSLELWNFRGAVAVSNNGSNFMVVTANHCLNPKSELEEVKFPPVVIEKYLDVGGAPHQDWKNTVFGQVIEGIEVAEKIAAAKDGERAAITGIKIEAA